MLVVVAPASPRTGRAIVEALLRDPLSPSVIGVYRDVAKAPSAFVTHSRFKAISGDVADENSLDFNGADAVVTISPPQHDGAADPVATARSNAEHVRNAIKRSPSVRRIVYVSSIGAHADQGTGELLTNHVAEDALRDAATEVVFVRCAYFMYNWNQPTLRDYPPSFKSAITPINFKIPMVAVDDIGRTCAREAVAVGGPLPEHPHIFELHGPEKYSTADVQQALACVIGEELRVELVHQRDLDQFYASFLPPTVAALFSEMNRSFLPGGPFDASKPTGGRVEQGSIGLREAFSAMLGAWHCVAMPRQCHGLYCL